MNITINPQLTLIIAAERRQADIARAEVRRIRRSLRHPASVA